jgi:hypothetical protein
MYLAYISHPYNYAVKHSDSKFTFNSEADNIQIANSAFLLL